MSSMIQTEPKMDWFDQMEWELDEYEQAWENCSHINKKCCFHSYYHNHQANQFSTCCGKRIRRKSKRIRAQVWREAHPEAHIMGMEELLLRRSTRHWWCMQCHTNGESGGHIHCGVCGFELEPMSSATAQRDILGK